MHSSSMHESLRPCMNHCLLLMVVQTFSNGPVWNQVLGDSYGIQHVSFARRGSNHSYVADPLLYPDDSFKVDPEGVINALSRQLRRYFASNTSNKLPEPRAVIIQTPTNDIQYAKSLITQGTWDLISPDHFGDFGSKFLPPSI